jgi:hypothetical protein
MEHRRQQVDDHAGGAAADAHPAGQSLVLAPHRFDGVVGVAQQAPATLHQHGAGRRGHDAPCATHDQRCAQARFQLADMQAHGGLRQMERLRGGGEGAEVGDGDQGAELVEVQVAHQES